MVKRPPPQRSIDTTQYNASLYKQMYGQAPEGKVTLPVSPLDHTDYSSVENFNDKQKLEFLKRPDFDPTKLKDPTMQLSAQMYRWSQIVKNIDAGKFSDKEKAIILDQAYGRMIAPALARTGQDPNAFYPVWKSQAFERGRDFNIDMQYQNNILQGNLNGIAGLLQDGMQIGKKLVNFMGAVVSPVKPITDESWDKQLKYTAAHVNNPVGFFDQLQAVADTTSPKVAKLRSALQAQSDKVEFYQALRPNRSFTSKATSMAVESAPFAAAALMPEGITAESAGALDVLIGSSKAGRLASGFLENAASGFVYGALTTKENDLKQAYKEALTWGVGGTVLHIGGMSVAWLGGKLLDKGSSMFADAMAKRANMEKLVEEGRTEASPEEVSKESEVARSELIATHGLAGARASDNAAANHILTMEKSGMSDDEIRAYEINLLKNGTPADRHMLDSVFRIRTAMGSTNLSNMGQEEKANLFSRLMALDGNAAGRMTKNVAVLQEALRQRFMGMDPKTLNKNVMGFLMQQVLPQMKADAKPEEIIKAAQAKWADYMVEAGKYAEDQLLNDPFKDAKKAVSRRNQSEKEAASAVGVTTRTRRTVNKRGEPAVSFSVSPQWKVYAKNAVKKAGKAWDSAGIKEWLDGLDDSDFATDLYSFFMPKFLRDAQMHFEPGSTTGGKDYSNLFAFMYNFREQMPKEYAEMLDEKLGDTPKFQRFYEEIRNNPNLTAAQKKQAQMSMNRQHALVAWNHMDNLLGSGRFPKESNYFRSTDTDMNNPTVWMNELFEERVQKETDTINKMYGKDTPENKAAKGILKVFFKERRQAHQAGEQVKVRLSNEAIAQILRQGSKGKKGAGGLEHRVRQEFGAGLEDALQSTELINTAKIPITPAEEAAKKAYSKAYHEANDAKTAASEERKKAFQAYLDFKSSVFKQTGKWPQDEDNPLYKGYLDAKDKDEAAGSTFINIQFPTEPQLRAGKDLWQRDAEDKSTLGGAVRKDKHGKVTVWLGTRLMDSFYRAVDPYSAGGTKVLRGQSIGHDDSQIVLRNLQSRLKNKPDDQRDLIALVTKAFHNAGPEGINLVQLQPSIRATIGTYKEEWTHAWQRVMAPGKDITQLFPDHVFDKLFNEIPAPMQNYLNQNYGGKPAFIHVLEASAKVICKKPELHGLTQNEAIDYAWKFFEEVHNHYGSEAFEHLSTAYGSIESLRKMYADLK